ncbi:MAG: glycosyltransferase family 2 protein [Prevotella sp.]|nr:glycosyltransferase family 2 protein [Prevotella sp.]
MISVVIPVYNSADTIASCIESVLRQSVTELELIIVDDGSTDQSGSICDDYAQRDRRICVVHQPNKGRTEARAEGVRRAQGEWLSFVDSDDMLPADSLALLSAKAGDDVDIVLGNGYSLPDESREQIPMADFRHMAIRADGTIGVPWGSLYRRRLLTPWLFDMPRHIVNGEDYLFWLRLVFSTERPVAVVYESVYDKGAEHTSSTFKWTAEYCYELNELRKASIPQAEHDNYLPDMLDDRIANMFSVGVWQRRSEWCHSQYLADILADLRRLNRSLPLRQRLFLALPSLRLRRLYSMISQKLR